VKRHVGKKIFVNAFFDKSADIKMQTIIIMRLLFTYCLQIYILAMYFFYAFVLVEI